MTPNDPEKQQVGESDLNYRRRQQIQAKKEEEAKKGGLVNRGIDYGKNQLNRAKEYGTEKGKGAIESGVNYAKGKGKNFLDKNPKAAGAINRAQQTKQDFEDRMNAFKNSAELSARKPPIKQRPGETDKEFLERQRAEDTGPDNPQRMSFGQAAKQHAKDYGKKQLGKGMDYARNKGKDVLAKNPKLAAEAEKAKARANAIKEKLALAKIKKDNFTKRLKALKDRYNLKKKAENKAKQLATQIAKQFVMFVARIITAIIASFGYYLLIALLIILIIVVVIAAINYLCGSTWLGQAVCNIFL